MGAQARILIVDDDPWVQRMVATVLHQRGHTIFTASDGVEGLSLAEQVVPDLIITDVIMPRMDGWTFVKHLRSRTHLSLVPVIFLSALSSDDDRIRGFRLGADDYLPKPFRFEELDLRVANALKKQRALTSSMQPAIREPGRGLHGSLDQFGLSSLLALLEMERKTGILVLSRGSHKGRIFLREGRVVAAVVEGGLSGAEAVYHLLAWADGQFEFAAVEVEMEDTVGLSTTHLLMEGARRIDEAHRGGPVMGQHD